MGSATSPQSSSTYSPCGGRPAPRSHSSRRASPWYPERTAIVFGDDRITCRALDAAADRVANLLVSRGIQPGDNVALSCPDLPHFTSVYFGILKAGSAVVPLNVLLKAREVAYHLTDSDAMAYFAFEGTAELPIGQTAWGDSRPPRAAASSS